MSHFENKPVASSACPTQRADATYQVDSSRIYHLPDEILSQICSYATAAKALPLQIDDESQPSLRTELQTAHALCLVSRRFNRLSTPFLFRSLIFTQTKLTGRPLTQRDLSSRPELQEPHSLNKLFTLLRDRPDFGQHCTSLCFNYREEAIDDFDFDFENDDQGSSEDSEDSEDNEDSEDSKESEDSKDSMSDDEIDNMFPPESLLNYLYGQLTNVRDFQINMTGVTEQTPIFVLSLFYMTKLRRLYITGRVNHMAVFSQIASLGSDYTPLFQFETLDLSNTTNPLLDHELESLHTIRQRGFLSKLRKHAGTGPIKRLLTDAIHNAEVLTALVAWPKILERLALQLNLSFTSRTLRPQQILDSQKQSLTHLRIHAKFKKEIEDLDLRGFPHLEHLALCNVALSSFSDPLRYGLEDRRSQYFAPRLKSLLWTLPWWLSDEPKTERFFTTENEYQLENLLNRVLENKRQRKAEEWCFRRVWVQCTVVAPECLEENARHNLENDLQRIKDLDDRFRPHHIRVRHLPLPSSPDADGSGHMVFSPDDVWSWDNNSYTMGEK